MCQALGNYQQASHYTQLQLDIILRDRPDNLSDIAYCHYDLGVCRYHQALQAHQNTDNDAANALLKQSEEYLKKVLASNMKMRGALSIDNQDVYKAQARTGNASNAYMTVLTMVERPTGSHPSWYRGCEGKNELFIRYISFSFFRTPQH